MDAEAVDVKQPAPKPELTMEEKLAIRDQQIALQLTREQGDAAIQNTTKAVNEAVKVEDEKLITVVKATFAAHGITDGKLDMRTLKFTE